MYTGIELTVICVAEIFLLASHYAARRRGLGHIFCCERGPDGPRYDYAAHCRGLLNSARRWLANSRFGELNYSFLIIPTQKPPEGFSGGFWIFCSPVNQRIMRG